jgi:serine/threonine-protein kinase
MVGKTISHYRILERSGEGGMGVVYKAQDLKLDRTVALKFLPPDLTREPEANERFIHEAKAASALDHQNVCTIHEIGETDDGQIFIVMGFYNGETLKERLAHGPLNIVETIDIAIQVAGGLAKAHEHGIVHRDIKADNIIVTADGVAKILDFGVAKLAGKPMLTKPGSTIGTTAYMSPEQAQGAEVDYRTDIWSLGVVLFELLAGRLPFEGAHEAAMLYSIVNEDQKNIHSIRPDLPRELVRIVRRALMKKPELRYASTNEMIRDLQTFRATLHSPGDGTFSFRPISRILLRPATNSGRRGLLECTPVLSISSIYENLQSKFSIVDSVAPASHRGIISHSHMWLRYRNHP